MAVASAAAGGLAEIKAETGQAAVQLLDFFDLPEQLHLRGGAGSARRDGQQNDEQKGKEERCAERRIRHLLFPNK